jgi:hypothetical protein
MDTDNDTNVTDSDNDTTFAYKKGNNTYVSGNLNFFVHPADTKEHYRRQKAQTCD